MYNFVFLEIKMLLLLSFNWNLQEDLTTMYLFSRFNWSFNTRKNNLVWPFSIDLTTLHVDTLFMQKSSSMYLVWLLCKALYFQEILVSCWNLIVFKFYLHINYKCIIYCMNTMHMEFSTTIVMSLIVIYLQL